MRDLTKLPTMVSRISMPAAYADETVDPTCMGAFTLESFSGGWLRVMAGKGYGWEHVSVSLAHRIPNYSEMKRVKRIFFEDHECVMELHVPSSEHINEHSFCLHLWRPTHKEIPRPPGWMVGGMTPEQALREMALLDPVTGEPHATNQGREGVPAPV